MQKPLKQTIGGLLLMALTVPYSGATEPSHEHHADHNETEHSGHSGHQAPEHTEPGHGEHEALTLSADKLRAFGGAVATAEAGVIRQQVSLPGEVHLNAEAVAHITPRFPAKILEVRARIGDEVKAGQTLAIAESSETLARFELESLIDGVVLERHITLGEHLKPDDTAFLVADLSILWADIALYPKQVPRVKAGQPVRITTRHGSTPVRAQIDYVAPQVDEHTRTGLARVFLNNEQRHWKPGMFIEGTITLGEFPADIVVPQTAVIDLENQATVFVRRAEHWEPRPVEVGREDQDSVEILSGLEPGDRYVADGGFVLKAQRQKSEFESGHNH